jgi:hypothetical protein
MKRLFILTALLSLSLTSLQAQEVYYALPRTTFTVQVEARQESFFAGPYASFAQKLLNMEARQKDQVNTVVTKATLIPRTEADPTAWYTTDAENSNLLALSAQGLVSFPEKAEAGLQAWRFPGKASASFNGGLITDTEKPTIVIEYKEVQTDTGLVTMPIEHKVMVDKTLEDKASEAAEVILHLRKERMNIVTGNTDANFYGNSMEVALKEMDRLEKEYLALFEGYTVTKTFNGCFEVVPSAGAGTQRYLVFRLMDDGFATEGTRGVPYYLSLEAENPQSAADESANQRRGKTNPLRFRTPLVCKVTFTQDAKPLISARVPVYQLGRESQYGK